RPNRRRPGRRHRGRSRRAISVPWPRSGQSAGAARGRAAAGSKLQVSGAKSKISGASQERSRRSNQPPPLPVGERPPSRASETAGEGSCYADSAPPPPFSPRSPTTPPPPPGGGVRGLVTRIRPLTRFARCARKPPSPRRGEGQIGGWHPSIELGTRNPTLRTLEFLAIDEDANRGLSPLAGNGVKPDPRFEAAILPAKIVRKHCARMRSQTAIERARFALGGEEPQRLAVGVLVGLPLPLSTEEAGLFDGLRLAIRQIDRFPLQHIEADEFDDGYLNRPSIKRPQLQDSGFGGRHGGANPSAVAQH